MRHWEEPSNCVIGRNPRIVSCGKVAPIPEWQNEVNSLVARRNRGFNKCTNTRLFDPFHLMFENKLGSLSQQEFEQM